MKICTVLLIFVSIGLASCAQPYVIPDAGPLANITVDRKEDDRFLVIQTYDSAGDCSDRKHIPNNLPTFAVQAERPFTLSVYGPSINIVETASENTFLTGDPDGLNPQERCGITLTFTPETNANYTFTREWAKDTGSCYSSFFKVLDDGTVQSVEFQERTWRNGFDEGSSFCADEL